MRRVLQIVVGFAHDFAAGIWAATVLGVWWLERVPAGGEVRTLLDALERQFFWIGVGCVGIVLATGAGRTFTYVDNHYGPDAERARRRALVLKHIVLFAIFGAGTFWQHRLAFG